MKTSELAGAALDWAVAKCEGHNVFIKHAPVQVMYTPKGKRSWYIYTPSTNWSQGGLIIAREMREHGFDPWSGIHIPHGQFAATYCRGAVDSYVYGPTPLIAAMRCYVASKLGDNVDVPQELL